jgi:5-methylcytosine-specific restriction endonuclease McrA
MRYNRRVPYKDPEKAAAYFAEYRKRPNVKAKHRATAAWRAALYRERHPERVREQVKRQNKKDGSARTKRWRERHPERIKKPSPEKQREYSRRHYEKDPERARAIWRRSNANHPERVLAEVHKRRAVLLGLADHFTAADVKKQLAAQERCCFYCRAPLIKYHIDHKTPLCRGGSDNADNIVCACQQCNLRKGRKTAEEFSRRRVP